MQHFRKSGRGRTSVIVRLAGAALLTAAVGTAGTAASTVAAPTRRPLHPGKLFPQTTVTPERAVQARRAAAAQLAAVKYDVTTYGYDAARHGKDNAETTLGTGNVGGLTKLWSNRLTTTGAMDATPVGLSSVPTPTGTKDLVYVGTERGEFGAMDANTGAVLWHKNLGFQHTNCGDFNNGDAGITGAAVIDRSTNRVYVVGGNGKLYALDLATGANSPGWTTPAITTRPGLNHVYGALTLDRNHNQVYATTASYCDHTPYQGQLIGVNTTTGAVRRWTVVRNKQNGGGIWGWGGVSLDTKGNPFLATGNALPNGAREATPYAEYVVKLAQSNFAVLGAHHPTLNGLDSDFGATPTLFQPAGCAPRLAAENKNGYVYIYRRNHLRAGPTQRLPLANKPGAHYFVGLPAWDASTNTLYVSDSAPGTGYTHGMVALRFGSAANGCKPRKLWNTAAGPTRSPVSSPTVANGVVYYGDGTGSMLHAFNAATGRQLWRSAKVGGPIFSAPLVMNGTVYASSRDGLLYAYR